MKINHGNVDCTPEEVGYDSSRLEAVIAFFQQMIETEIIFGVSYQIARRGKVIASTSLGSRDYKNPQIQMQPNTLFRIASQTKMFTAVAIQMLVEDGLVAINNPVSRYLPQFDGKPYNEITLLHLLTHSSGLYPEASIPNKHHIGAYKHIEMQANIDGLETDWIAVGLRAGLRRQPGEEWQYCSFGFAVLGAIVEKVTGIKFEKFIMERICKPLKMMNTSFRPTPIQAQNAIMFNERSEMALKEFENDEPKENSIWDIIPSAATGLYSTTEDMVRFGMMLQQWGRLGDTRILGRKAVENIATQRLHNLSDFGWGANDLDRKYGLGFDMRLYPGSLLSPGTFYHEGAGSGTLIIDPVEEIVCSCIYPWVNGKFNNICNDRLYNVIWSGII